MNKLAAVVVVSLVASVTQADDAEKKCIATLQEAWELALARAETVAEIDRQLGRVTPLWAQGKACGPKYRDLGDMMAGVPAAVAKKQQLRADLVEKETLAREADALETKLQTADDATWTQLAAEGKKLSARMAALQARTAIATDHRRRQLERAVADRRHEIDDGRKKDADNAARAEHDTIRMAMVTTRLGLAAADAYDVAKVREAFAKSPELVYTRADGYFEFAPAGTSHAKVPLMHFATPPARGGDVSLREGRMQAFYATRPSAPPAGTPGLAWNVDEGERIIFVSVDGGRYETTLGSVTVTRGERPVGEVRNTILTHADILALAKAGQVSAKHARELERLGDAARTCSDAIWKRAQPKFDAIAAAAISDETRAARTEQLKTTTFAAETRACGAHERGYRKVWSTVVDERRAQRAKLLGAM